MAVYDFNRRLDHKSVTWFRYSKDKVKFVGPKRRHAENKEVRFFSICTWPFLILFDFSLGPFCDGLLLSFALSIIARFLSGEIREGVPCQVAFILLSLNFRTAETDCLRLGWPTFGDHCRRSLTTSLQTRHNCLDRGPPVTRRSEWANFTIVSACSRSPTRIRRNFYVRNQWATPARQQAVHFIVLWDEPKPRVHRLHELWRAKNYARKVRHKWLVLSFVGDARPSKTSCRFKGPTKWSVSTTRNFCLEQQYKQFKQLQLWHWYHNAQKCSLGSGDCIQPHSDKIIPSVKWVRFPAWPGHCRSQGMCLINSRFNIRVCFSVFLSSKRGNIFYTNLSLHLFRGAHTHSQ